MNAPNHEDELPAHDHDRGLTHDLPGIVARGHGRRGMLGLLGGLGAAALAGCALGGSDTEAEATSPSEGGAPGGGPGGEPPDGGGPGAESAVEVADGEIPEETAGPFPGDGSNGVDALTESGVVRQDITGSFGSASGVADGVPLTVNLTVYDTNGSDVAPLAGAAVYLWHCDRDGNYSMYSEAVADENYLRGVQRRMPTGRSPSPASSPRPMPVAGRTSTSRSTRRSRMPPPRTTSCALPSSRCPRPPAWRSTTTPRATTPAWRTWTRSRSRPSTCPSDSCDPGCARTHS